MRRGDIGLDNERLLFTLDGAFELVDLLPQRREETFRYLSMLERLRAADGLTVQSPRAVESTEGRTFDVVLVGLTPAAGARALRLTHLPFRVGRLPVAGEAQPIEVNDLLLSDTTPFNVSRDHFTIERVPDGVQVRDRGSYVGTIVNGVQIGGHHRHHATGCRRERGRGRQPEVALPVSGGRGAPAAELLSRSRTSFGLPGLSVDDTATRLQVETGTRRRVSTGATRSWTRRC
jgi:hypothetical protein